MSHPTTETARGKLLEPTGVPEIDRLADLPRYELRDYLNAVSAYVRVGSSLPSNPKKAAQIRLSGALARAFADELATRIPGLEGKLTTKESKVAGGLRTVNADVSQSHILDGLRLAVELKPVNLAVGRAIWNRFGDIRTFAVNIHLKFPFAVVGGVLVIPTWEESGTRAARKAELMETAVEADDESENAPETAENTPAGKPTEVRKKSTLHLIQRAIDRLVRAGGRRSEAEAAHLLEGIAVVVYNPDTGEIDSGIPIAGSGLRWEEFLEALAISYKARFED